MANKGGRGDRDRGARFAVFTRDWIKFHVSCCRYPVDTGLFISGGMDGVVKLWDTNALDVVLEFNFQEKVIRGLVRSDLGKRFTMCKRGCRHAFLPVLYIYIVRPPPSEKDYSGSRR